MPSRKSGDKPNLKRAPIHLGVTIAMAAALLAAAMIASRLGLAAPVAWFALGLAWLALRWALFETARPTTANVVAWDRIDDPDRPDDVIAWPTLAIATTDGTHHRVRSRVGFYEYEFENTELPTTLAVRTQPTPLGPIVMTDDRAHILAGPALFAAATLLLSIIWSPLRALWV